MKISFRLFCSTILFVNCVSLDNLCLKISKSYFILNFFKHAIKCDFRYTEDDKNYPEQIIDSLMQHSFILNNSVDTSKEFICDDDLEKPCESEMSALDFFTTRFDGPTTSKVPLLDDDVDAESLCRTTTKTIHPKALPSVKNNKLVTVVNHGEFSQSVTIEECMYVIC